MNRSVGFVFKLTIYSSGSRAWGLGSTFFVEPAVFALPAHRTRGSTHAVFERCAPAFRRDYKGNRPTPPHGRLAELTLPGGFFEGFRKGLGFKAWERCKDQGSGEFWKWFRVGGGKGLGRIKGFGRTSEGSGEDLRRVQAF